MLKLKGSQHLRQRLVLATLTGKTIRIDDIRANDQNPGLRDFEASLLRLIEKITNGCIVEINETGTTLRYKPGFIVGGEIVHDCGKSRGIGYFLEPLVCIAIFGKKPLRITLRGVTNNSIDPSVDTWRTVTFPILRSLIDVADADDLQLKVLQRGCTPLGGGEVWVNVPIIKALPNISLKEEGMVKRIRGIAFSARVSPQSCNRMVDGARGVLNSLLADVFVFTDHVSGSAAGLSPGYGLTLVAETTTKNLISAEGLADVTDKAREQEMVPEEVGKRAACALLDQIHAGGTVDQMHQGLAILLCALGPDEINEVRTGPLTPYAVRSLRCLKEMLGVTFSIKPEPDSETVFLACIGANIRNNAKNVT